MLQKISSKELCFYKIFPCYKEKVRFILTPIKEKNLVVTLGVRRIISRTQRELYI